MFYRQLGNELWKLFGKKRTYIGFFVFLLAQNIILLIFRFSHANDLMRHLLEANGYSMGPFYSSLTFATGMAFPLAYLLIPLYVSLVGGDLVAKEVEDGTLRMILGRPITRFRLLLLKWLSGMVFAVLLVLALGVFGLGFASAWFPWGGLFVYIPNDTFSVLDATTGWHRYLGAHLFLTLKACTILTLAFMFSCFNMKPAAAAILSLSFVYLNGIMMNIPFFHGLSGWFLTAHLNFWQLLFREHIPWWRVWESISILAGFNVTCLTLACAAFQMRDFKA